MKNILFGTIAFFVCFELYDLINPNHFTGDIYGYIVFCRLCRLIPVLLLFGLAFLFLFMGKRFSKCPLKVTGYCFVVICWLLFCYIAIDTGLARLEWVKRNTYLSKSTEDLIQIATTQEDQFAIDVFFTRRDPNAVPGLSAILLDNNKRTSLRDCAAHALGAIGNSNAEKALLEARKSVHEKTVLDAIDYAIEVRIKRRPVNQ